MTHNSRPIAKVSAHSGVKVPEQDKFVACGGRPDDVIKFLVEMIFFIIHMSRKDSFFNRETKPICMFWIGALQEYAENMAFSKMHIM